MIGKQCPESPRAALEAAERVGEESRAGSSRRSPLPGLVLALRRKRGRHRLRARVMGKWRGWIWSRRLGRLARRRPDRPIVVVALCEHMGDIVAAEPIARYLRREEPRRYLVWVVRSPYRELVETHPDVDRAIAVGCLSEWIEMARAAWPGRRIDLHVNGKYCETCGAVLEKTGGDVSVHMGNYYLHGNLLSIACRGAGLPVLEDAPRVYIGAKSRKAVDRLALPERFVVVHCVSHQEVRDWTTEKWRRLARRLVEEDGIPVVEVGLRPVIEGAAPGCVSLCGKLSILETAEVIRRAALFIGIDSGPAHLANAVGTPGVILLGRYRRYDRYLPYSGGYGGGGKARLIQHDGPAAEIPLSAVHRLARRALGLADD